MKAKTILYLMLSFIMASCGNNKGKDQSAVQKDTTTMVHQQDSSEEVLQLNKGAKWKIDDNMMSYLRTMEKDLNGFNKTELNDYLALSKELIKNCNLLVTKCTMSGPAHEELHKWLAPYIELVNAFSESKTKQEAEGKFRMLKNSFLTFNEFFQ